MVDPQWLLGAAAAASVLGFGWLALAMDTHWAQAHGPAAQKRGVARRLRVVGALAITLSLGLCLAANHPSMAVLVWIMLLAGSAVAIAMTLAWRPQWLRRLWPAQ
jgi:hypothetical protein